MPAGLSCSGPSAAHCGRHAVTALVTVEKLTKQYRRVTAVTEVSFAVERGSVTGFLGPNGSGKTTTLRILLELVTATAGRALIDGRRYRGSASACSS